MQSARISTQGLHGPCRTALVRDAAFDLFNLEADLDGAAPAQVHADIRVRRGASISVVDVATSWSIVRRTAARASAATSDDLLLYVIEQGGSWFRNARGEQFLTTAGSVVVGSQAAAYSAAAAQGRDWRFRAMRIAGDRLPLSANRIRHGGFQPMPHRSPVSALASDYLASLAQRCDGMAAHDADAALRALDVLLAAALGDGAAVRQDDGVAMGAARLSSARSYIECELHDARLSPELVARHLGISARQLHRIFERHGTTIALDIRQMRVARAQAVLARDHARPVTDVALACGFDSLPTFYRCFRAVAGMTATEWRAQGVVDRDVT